MANKKGLTISELIDELKKHDINKDIEFDFCGFLPNGVHSSRWCAKDIAIGYRPDDGDFVVTKDILEKLENILETEICSWKNDIVFIAKDARVFVGNKGESSYTVVNCVKDDESVLILKTTTLE